MFFDFVQLSSCSSVKYIFVLPYICFFAVYLRFSVQYISVLQGNIFALFSAV